MQLTPEQLQSYEESGFLCLPDLFSSAEVELMRAELPILFAEDSERRVVEKGTQVVRSVYGSHTTNEVFRTLASHPRLVEAAMQILGTPVYVYQFKINAKIAFFGDVWEWHQDYIFWRREDGVPQPRLVNISVFLDEVHEFNGPLLFIPGSHKEGVLDSQRVGGVPEGYENSPDWIANLTASLKYSIGKEVLSRLVDKAGIVAPKGQAGSVLFFHPDVVHGSAPNMSPFDRRIVLVTYNSIENLPAETRRPDFLVSRDFTPVVPVGDLALCFRDELASVTPSRPPAAHG